MNILYIVNGIPSSGHRIHSYNLVKELSKDHEISLVCFESDSPYVKEYEYYKNVQQVPLKISSLLKKGLKSILTGTPYCVITYQSKNMLKVIENITKEVKFDVVLIEPLALGSYWSSINDCPRLLFPVDATSRIKEQNFIEEKNLIKKLVHYLDFLLVKKYEGFIYKKFNGIIFCSDYDSKYTVKNIKVSSDKVFTLPLAVDQSFYYPAESSGEELSIAFVGNMGHPPNPHGMIWFHKNVWNQLKERYPDLLFYIIGSEPPQYIKDLAVKDKNIIVTGYVDDIRPYIWKASLFISPLQKGTGMKNKVLQAMAMGKAIISSPLDIQGTVAEDNKHLVVARTPAEYVEKIDRLLTDKKKRKELGSNACDLVTERYSLAIKSERFLNIVKTIIDNR